MSESLHEIMSKLWTTPERAEWTPKTDVVTLSEVQRRMAGGDAEILGFTRALLGAMKFRGSESERKLPRKHDERMARAGDVLQGDEK
ncbi:MAG: hypothetical protein WA211_17060 [Candidatus Acidiferrales bacterium]|jgi:hypothetical protein